MVFKIAFLMTFREGLTCSRIGAASTCEDAGATHGIPSSSECLTLAASVALISTTPSFLKAHLLAPMPFRVWGVSSMRYYPALSQHDFV